MSELIALENGRPPAGHVGAAGSRTPERRRRPKAALVLGGGGFTAGVYEIGALRALDLLAVDRNVNQFDVYVGTSAGAVVAAMAANGISPEQMIDMVDGGGPMPFRRAPLGMMLRPNYREFVTRGARLPLHLAGLLRTLGRVPLSFSPVELAVALAEALPSGLYTGSGIEQYVREVLTEPGRTNDFRELGSELYLAATDLDTCERVVLGSPGWDDVPISEAVWASTAMPMLYKPVGIRDRTFIDGGISSTTNLDLAVEAGASLVIVINPLVPFINDSGQEMRTLFGSRVRRVSDMGFPKVGYQTFKFLAHQRLHDMTRDWQRRHPDVDVVLIEPEPDDHLMFETNVMDYASRLDVAQHGFRSVTMKLAGEYEQLNEIARRHGIEISETRVRQMVKDFSESDQRPAWRRLLSQRAAATLRRAEATERG
jgi:predicted acylesterase/phospholipase RssA